jgi:hypothetical protein
VIYAASVIVRVIKSRRFIWAGEGRNKNFRIFVGNQLEGRLKTK